MRLAPLALAVVAALLLAGCAAPQTPGNNATSPTPTPGGAAGAKLLFGTEAAFPPFEDIDASTQQVVGFDADLGKALAAKMGRTAEFRNLKFDALIPSVQNGQVDAAVSAMSITDERKQQVDFTLPYYEANQTVTVRSSENGIQGPDDLAGKNIGVQLGTTAETWLVENLVKPGKLQNSSIKRYESFPLSVEALKRGDVQAVMMDAPAVKDAVRSSGGAIKIVFDITTGEQYGIAVKKGNSAVLLGLNQALRDLTASGDLQELKDKWAV